jgi:hypothetical protein
VSIICGEDRPPILLDRDLHGQAAQTAKVIVVEVGQNEEVETGDPTPD